tara:strand:- start:207 stop:860 length:654 start_codon:yes stop_codon:yes gene_type:complete
MGVENNQFQIENLNSNTSFFEWFTKTNEDIIAKLNKLKIYDIDISGSLAEGISAELGTSGGHTSGILNLGIGNTIPHGVTIEGSIVRTGSNSFIVDRGGGTLTNIVGKFVCYSSDGGITLSSGSSFGITFTPFHKNESIGVVKSISGDNVEIVGSGLFSGLTGLTAGQVYFLDASTANMGGFTTNPPTGSGQTKKKLFLSTGTSEAIIQIGDSEIIS